MSNIDHIAKVVDTGRTFDVYDAEGRIVAIFRYRSKMLSRTKPTLTFEQAQDYAQHLARTMNTVGANRLHVKGGFIPRGYL